jgi:pilus assembly protein Flp/PilA
MRKFIIESLAKDEEGAALVEYSLLVGIITVAAVGSIILVGPWVGQQWQGLVTALGLS